MGIQVPFAPYLLVVFFFFVVLFFLSDLYVINYLEERLRPIKLKKQTKQIFFLDGMVTECLIISLSVNILNTDNGSTCSPSEFNRHSLFIYGGHHVNISAISACSCEGDGEQ